MPFVFLTGGARSGKSGAAQRLAERSPTGVVVIATAEAGDEEMAVRIARHREERPAGWETIEEPHALSDALRSVPDDGFVIVDCLTLWVSNRFDRPDDEVLAEAGEAAILLARRAGGGVVVSNEVGDGIVPADPATRRYRDLLGAVNRRFADTAERSYLMVAGRAVRLEPMPW